MKRKIFALLILAALAFTLSLPVCAAENASHGSFPTDGIIAHFKLDGDIVNSVTGESAIPMGREFTDPYYEMSEKNWYYGVDGYAYYGGDGDGFCTNINPGNGDFSVAFWINEACHMGITPYMWYGSQKQWDTEHWLSIWNVSVSTGWTMEGVTVGSNDPAVGRIEIVPESAAKYSSENLEFLLQWTHIAISCELDEKSNTYSITMYVNGEKAGENVGFTNPYAEDAYIYFNGINAWADSPSSGLLDDIVIYEKALNSKEVDALYGYYDAGASKIYANIDEMHADKVSYKYIMSNPCEDVIDYTVKESAPQTGLSTIPLAILTTSVGFYIAKKKK